MVKYKNKFKTAHSVKFYLFNVETSITKFNFFSEFEFNIKILPRSRRAETTIFFLGAGDGAKYFYLGAGADYYVTDSTTLGRTSTGKF